MMAQTLLVVLSLLSSCMCFFSFGVYSAKSFVWKTTHKEATFLFSGMFHGSPAQVTEKYELSIYPAPWAISIIWPIVLFWNIAAQVYLLVKNDFNLKHSIFYMWCIAWNLTTIWTFLFDSECHVWTMTVVVIVVIASCRGLVEVCQVHNAQKTKNLNHPFRYLVVEAFAILTTWGICALAISIGYALAYKNSLHSKKPMFTEILTPEESATLGAIFILASFLVWWILDTAYWVEKSECIRTIYPGFALIILSLGLSNYSSDRGMTLNNALCFGLGLLSAIAYLTRDSMKALFLKHRGKATRQD